MTNDSLKHLKDSLNFTSWTTFIHQNSTFCNANQCSTAFWNWIQCTSIMKRISVTWDCNALSVTEVYCWFIKQIQNLKIVYKNVPHLCHCCYTQTSSVIFSAVVLVVWWIFTLRFTQDFLKIFNENHQWKSKILKRPHFDFTKLWSASSESESSDMD